MDSRHTVREMYSRIIVPLARSPAKYLQQFSPEHVPFTNFVFGKSSNGDGIQEVYITDGKMDHPTEHHVNLHKAKNYVSDLPLFIDTLGPSSPLDRCTRSLLLSQNRLILSGSPKKSLASLRSLGDLVKDIRIIDFQFLNRTISEWMEPESSLRCAWVELARFIIEDLTVNDLVLSLHTGPCYNIHMEQNLGHLHVTHATAAYMSMVEPLQGLGEIKLKEFCLYWACFHDHVEEDAECAFMEKYYRAGVRISRKERQPYHPLRNLWDRRNPIDQ